MAKRIYQSSKKEILLAAREILLKEGLGNLTTENLIKKSGMSKGGFFYHFKTKNDLIKALEEMIIREMEEEIYQEADKDKKRKGATLRAYLNYTLSDKNDEMIALCRSLVEVLFDKSSEPQGYKEFYKRFVKRVLSEDIDKNSAMAVLFALDGYWYNEVFGISFFSKKDTKNFIKHLAKFTL